jgi:hypothetical protein
MVASTLESKELFHQRLQVCSERMYKVSEAKDWQEVNRYASIFMDSFFELYLILQCYPSLKESSEYQDFIRSSIPFLWQMSNGITHFQMDLHESLIPHEYYDADWSIVCPARSALEGLKEIYEGVYAPEVEYYFDLKSYFTSEDFDCEELDGEMQCRIFPWATEDGIPIGIPRSHWWWWGEKAEDNLAA